MTPRNRKHAHRGSYAAIGAVVLLLGAALAGGAFLELPVRAGKPSEVTVAKGMTTAGIGRLLAGRGIIRSAQVFVAVARIKGYDGRMRAGVYTVPPGMRTSETARFFAETRPRPVEFKVTVAEGLNAREIASLLARRAGIDSLAFASLALGGAAPESLGVDNATFEGYLYPDTYFIDEGTKPYDVIRKMTARFREVFTDSLTARAKALGMTVNEAVTLASLVETEAADDSERAVISSVFHHRLRAGLPLQANPTVQYALGVKRRVMNGDLEVDSPFNTYLRKGLPPGPIANPGLKSIIAALYPADTKFLYFVSDGSGGHVFSRTLAEHNAAVARYMKARARR
jgi:UPF0755 protein